MLDRDKEEKQINRQCSMFINFNVSEKIATTIVQTYQFQHCAHLSGDELKLSVQVHNNGYTCLFIQCLTKVRIVDVPLFDTRYN